MHAGCFGKRKRHNNTNFERHPKCMDHTDNPPQKKTFGNCTVNCSVQELTSQIVQLTLSHIQGSHG